MGKSLHLFRYGPSLAWLVALLVSGCASVVLPEPETGMAASSQWTQSLALRKALRRIDFREFGGRRVYVPGALGFDGMPGVISRGVDDTVQHYVSNLLLEGLLFAGGQVALEAKTADLALLVIPEVVGAQMTHRIYRFQGYPIYVHDEDYHAVRVAILGYDYRKDAYFDVVTGISFGNRVEPYVLDLFGFEVYW